MPVKVLTRIVKNTDPTDVRGVGSSADIAAGIRFAVDHGARVLNLSLGGNIDTLVERDAIAYAIAQGAVVVAAMGNAAHLGNPTSYPAAYPDVVAVGAINQADQRPFFSQTGPHIDVVAPGVGVLSTVWDNGYTTKNGTSMATPHVSGVAALIMSCNSNMTGPQVADIIRQTARPLRDNPADPVPNDNYGWGCVDAKAAIDRACPLPPPTRFPTFLICCKTREITCQSRLITCQSRLITCQSRLITCRILPILCEKTVLIRCPTQPILCERSALILCPSDLICSPGDRPIEDPYDTGAEDWSTFDPYELWYGDADE